MFCKWQSIYSCACVCVSVGKEFFMCICLKMYNYWNTFRGWKSDGIWNDDGDSQHNQLYVSEWVFYATSVVLCVRSFVQLLYNMPFVKTHWKGVYPRQKKKTKKFEMGLLKAIADNQHVKYVIFARYAQNVRVRKERKKRITTQTHTHIHTYSRASIHWNWSQKNSCTSKKNRLSMFLPF